MPAVKSALQRLGAYTALRTLLPSRRVAILRYHAVCRSEGHRYADPAICVSPDAFVQHARYLARHYCVLPLPEVVARIRSGRDLPRNAVAITFDDGYADNLAAARTLAECGLTATFYLTAGCLAGGEPFWPAEVRALVHALPKPELRVTASERAVEIPVATDAERGRAIRTVTRLVKSHPIRVREALRAQLRRAAGGAVAPECMLTWEQVAEMQRLGMTIGAHTLTHPNLPSAGLTAAREEIVGSKALLERATGTPVTLFAYPNGGAERYMTGETARLVREAGFEAAVTSRNAFAGPASDLYGLERVQVQERLEDLVFALEVERFVRQPKPRSGEVPAG